MIKLTTNKGVITLELDHDNAPITAANFEQYVKDGFYDGVIFHRVIPNFMIQGGGMTPDMKEKDTREPIQNEAQNGLKNDKYTIAMARTMAPHSASAQFFINTKDNDFLNHTSPSIHVFFFAVFVNVSDGFDGGDAIEKVSTKRHVMHYDVPVEPVVIEKAEIV